MVIAAASDRPVQVTRAVALLVISLVLGLLAWPGIIKSSPPAVTMPSWFFPVIAFWSFGLPALLTFLIFRGHNWARIFMLVLFAQGVLLSLWQLPELLAGSRVRLAVEGACTLLCAVALYLLFTAPSSSWFRRS